MFLNTVFLSNDRKAMELLWVEDLLPEGYLRKRMFGGYAFYLDEKLVLVLFESEGNKEYRGEKFDFEIWNGCLFPVEKHSQPDVLRQFPFLVNHPVLPKWLYLPAESEDFEGQVQLLLREIRKHNPLFGTIPKAKRSAGLKKTTKKDDEKIIDTRRPRMFSEEPVEDLLKKARKISDLKNLGPESEKHFLKAGIKTPQQVIKLGWKKTMALLVKSNSKHNHSIYAYAVIGALQNKMWNLISEEDKREARAYMKSLREKGSSKKETLKKKTQKKRR